MSLRRKLTQDLLNWHRNPSRKPLLIRGARQVGKSYLIETFAQQYFDNYITINFEVEPNYKKCFNTLKPSEICNAIRVLSGQEIIPKKTLLFFDEIQDCPEAIQALRYFKEQLPDLHVIGAGSLLELALHQANFRMPVGRVSFLYLYPLSFKEFLWAYSPDACHYIENCGINNPAPPAIHEHLLSQVKLYMLLGGMPDVLANYQMDSDIQHTQAIQSSIIETYEKDFGHYAGYTNVNILQLCYRKLPTMIGQQIKYNKIDPDIRSRDLKQGLSALEHAGILHQVTATKGSGLPLESTINTKKFKLNFIDVGLVKRINQLDAGLLLNEDIMLINKGALAEQFVGQELLANAQPYEKTKLYFWARDGYSIAEIDYITVLGAQIHPIEVKAGKLGTLRSLQQYLKERPDALGIRLSEQPLKLTSNILSVPLYMVSELERLCTEP